jgi:electron transfer flavoprotein-quinone oxidoreductase
MVVGDAAVMISGRRGTDLAMLSGKYAAEAAIIAKARGDYSEDILKNYQQRLDNSFFMKDIKANKGMLEYNEKYQDADLLLSSTANEVAYKFFQEETVTSKEKMKDIIERVTNKQLPFKTVDDIIMGIKHWGFF